VNVNFKIGKELKAMRQAKHISQAKLSEGLCSVSTLVRIESNRQMPSFELVNALTERMGVSIDKLIYATNYSHNNFYYMVKSDMRELANKFRLSKVKTTSQMISNDLYDNLPLIEQQFVDRMRVYVAMYVDKDLTSAHQLAINTLNKTFNMKSQEFYSSEELRLLTTLVVTNPHASKHVENLLKALHWLELQPQYMMDYEAWILLITALMIYHFMHANWHEALAYANKGYRMALSKGKAKYIFNFMFGRGLCLYQTKVDVKQGVVDMNTALKFALQFGMHELSTNLMEDIAIYDIDLQQA